MLRALAEQAGLTAGQAHAYLLSFRTRGLVEQEAATARRIQGGLLPDAPHDIPGWSCLARLEPCHEVAGDLYDFHRRPDGTWVVLGGDVSGKGMGAALYMSSMLSAARVLYESRLVGLLGQPESLFTTAAHALDYQFGFKVSDTWFFQFLQKENNFFFQGRHQYGVVLHPLDE